MDTEKLLELCNRLVADMFMAERCLNCEKILSEKILSEEKMIHSAFFELARQSFLYTGTIILCKAFEEESTHNRPFSIMQILQWTRNTVKLSQKERAQLEKLENEYQNNVAIEKLKTQRDKFYAHNDKIDPDDLVNTCCLLRNEKLSLIHFALKVLSFVTCLCKQEPVFCYRDRDESTKRLQLILDDLEQYHNVILPWIWQKRIEEQTNND